MSIDRINWGDANDDRGNAAEITAAEAFQLGRVQAHNRPFTALAYVHLQFSGVQVDTAIDLGRILGASSNTINASPRNNPEITKSVPTFPASMRA